MQLKKDLLAVLLREQSPGERTPDLALVHGPWGKPYLLVDGVPGPGVSFSWSAGSWWAALGTPGSWLGLDAAAPGEFTGAYPFAKVFSAAEWRSATSLTAGNPQEAAALLWSVKEAVVKARGCGYCFFGPREVRVDFAGPGEHSLCWRGSLEAPCPDPAPPGSRETLPVAAIRLPQVWLAVAWMGVAPGTTPASAG